MAPIHHLLTIPREIRDIVYEHLLQDVNFQYKWAEHGYEDNPDHFAGYYTIYLFLSTDVQVCVQDAPPPNAMLTHSRLNDELKDTMGSSLRKHSVTIRIEEQTPRLPLQPLPNRLSGASVNDAFFQVRHVTILVSGGSMRGLTVEPVENWIYIEKLIDTVTHKMPHLTTIRVAQQSFPAGVTKDLAWPSRELAHGQFFTSPPTQVSGFSLAQRAEGHRLQCEESGDGVWTLITTVGCYTYQVKGSDLSTKHFWAPEQIMEVWPNTEFLNDTIGYQPQPREVPYKFKGWEEKRGYAGAKAW
jgi:hypothetical protein